MIVKRSSNYGDIPTVAPSSDHTDGTWSVLDLYSGEFFLDEQTGKLYYRSSGGIRLILTSGTTDYGNYPLGIKVYRALLTQTGTAAPTATVLQNTLGGTLVWTRLNVGEYKATLASAFPDADKLFPFMGTLGSATAPQLFWNDANSVLLNTAGPTTYPVLEDDLLQKTSIEIIVFP